MPELTELTVTNYKKAVTDLDRAKFAQDKYEYEDSKKTKVGFFEETTSEMEKAGLAIDNALRSPELESADRATIDGVIKQAYASTGQDVVEGMSIPGKIPGKASDSDVNYAVSQVSFENPINITSANSLRTTVLIRKISTKTGGWRDSTAEVEYLSEAKTVSMSLDELKTYRDTSEFEVSTLDGSIYHEENFKDLDNVTSGRQDSKVSLAPSQVNTSLGYFDKASGNWNRLTKDNAQQYRDGTKGSLRDFTGRVTVSTLVDEDVVTFGQSAAQSFQMKEGTVKKEREINLLGSWTGVTQVAGTATDRSDNQLLENSDIYESESKTGISVRRSSSERTSIE